MFLNCPSRQALRDAEASQLHESDFLRRSRRHGKTPGKRLRYRWLCPECHSSNDWDLNHWCPLCWANGLSILRQGKLYLSETPASLEESRPPTRHIEDQQMLAPNREETPNASAERQQEPPAETPQESQVQAPGALWNFPAVFRSAFRFLSAEKTTQDTRLDGFCSAPPKLAKTEDLNSGELSENCSDQNQSRPKGNVSVLDCLGKGPWTNMMIPMSATVDSDAATDHQTSEESDTDESSESLDNEPLPSDHPFMSALPVLVRVALRKFSIRRVCQQKQEDGSTETQGQGKQQASPRTQSGGQGSSRSRKRGLSGGKGEDVDERGRDASVRSKRLKAESGHTGPTLACPYYKHNQYRYAGCLRFELNRIKDVKQHLNREHKQPLYCPTCGARFNKQDQQMEHIRARLCHETEFGKLEGINQDQKEALSSRVDRKLSIDQQWFSVWDIVFGDEARPASPWIFSPVQEVLGAFRDFWEIEGPSTIAEQLGSGEIAYEMPREERDLAALCARVATEAVNTLFRTLLERYSSAQADEEGVASGASDDLSVQVSMPSAAELDLVFQQAGLCVAEENQLDMNDQQDCVGQFFESEAGAYSVAENAGRAAPGAQASTSIWDLDALATTDANEEYACGEFDFGQYMHDEMT